MVKLSLCIPYYKTYDLTAKLLDVLIPQMTDEVELIVEDDGCNEKRLDAFVDKVEKGEICINHNTENKGGAANSNRCIKRAKGKYVALIDSDDMVTENYVEELLKAIDEKDTDLIYMGWQDIETKDVNLHPCNYAPWKCIYKKEKMPRFIENWIYSFDVPFHEEVEKMNLSKYYIEKVLYLYNSSRPDNLTHKKEIARAKGEL